MCKNRSEENKAKYKNVKNRTKKVVASSMRKKAEKELTKSNKKSNNMTAKEGRLGFNKKDRKRIWKNYMEDIMNKENDWDHVTQASMVEGGPIKNVTREEMAIAIKVMKPGKAAGSSEVWAEMISASGVVGVSVMVELCQRVLDEKGMPDEWQTSVVVPIFKEKGDVRN